MWSERKTIPSEWNKSAVDHQDNEWYSYFCIIGHFINSKQKNHCYFFSIFSMFSKFLVVFIVFHAMLLVKSTSKDFYYCPFFPFWAFLSNLFSRTLENFWSSEWILFVREVFWLDLDETPCSTLLDFFLLIDLSVWCEKGLKEVFVVIFSFLKLWIGLA